MNIFQTGRRIRLKITAVAAVCLVFVNTFSWSLPQPNIPVSRTALQVQSIFKPILDIAGWEYEARVRVETALILATVLKNPGMPFRDINAMLDKWHSIIPDTPGERLLNVVSDPARDEDSVVIEVELCHGSRKGQRFMITSDCKALEDLSGDGSIVKIEEKPAFIPITASEAFYTLREEAARGVEEAVSRQAASIITDGETGQRKYFKQGSPFVPVQAHVYIKEGSSWDMPPGVELPGYMDGIMNSGEGALLLTTGPFYVKKEEAPNTRYIRPLSDQEVYDRFGLKRVYGRDGQPFEMPVLGVGGRSLLLPVPYMITTVRAGEGIKIAGQEKDARDRILNKRHVFGLEFKNAGTPAYKRHNIGYDFPSTTFEEHVDKPGIFLDWWHQVGTRHPVGLGVYNGDPLERESFLLAKGGKLTRWTLDVLPLEGPYCVSLRVPVGDYRRLSVFFKEEKPDRDVFDKIVEESGLTIDEFLSELSGNYGRNLRCIIEKGIIQSQHGSIINSDIFGYGVDLEDFYEIEKADKAFFEASVHTWVDNLIKVLNIPGIEYRDAADKALREFAVAFFGGSGRIDRLQFDTGSSRELKDSILEYARGIAYSPDRDTGFHAEGTEGTNAGSNGGANSSGRLNGRFRTGDTIYYAEQVSGRREINETLDAWFDGEEKRYFRRRQWNHSLDNAAEKGQPGFFVRLRTERGGLLGIAYFHKEQFTFVEKEESWQREVWMIARMEVSEGYRGEGVGEVLLAAVIGEITADLKTESSKQILVVHPAEDEGYAQEGKSAKRFFFGTGFEIVNLSWWEQLPEDEKEENLYLSISGDGAKRLLDKVRRPTIKPAASVAEPVYEQLSLFPEDAFTQIPEVEKIKAKNIITGTDSRSRQVFSRVRSYLIEALDEAAAAGREIPIDIVIDLSLISRNDLRGNMETWAYLILSCSELENVNFIFEKPDLSGGGIVPDALANDIRNAAPELEAVALLTEEIKTKALQLDMYGYIGELTGKRINAGRRENAIEIPLISKALLERARDGKTGLMPNQYPVALEGFTADGDGSVLLRNFEAALTIGLAKAALVAAQRRDELPQLRKALCGKLQNLYDVFMEDVTLTEETLDNMIHHDPVTRLNLAISLALPPITRMAVEKFQDIHDSLQLVLHAV
ncbi:MAG: hypothetical protein DRP85_08320 [Candidatus Makaraimicrobium thalassicum]|nr:MAG: hypothetical protein DRP85_08320 [Candidatus Omnitrophota bacterium]